MKIVICDDSIEDLIKIEKLLRKYMGSYTNTEIEVEKYSNPSQLYNKICGKELADIYILDMLMDEKSGIDIGNRIRKADSKNVIIYVTSSDEFALDAYRVQAARYLLKPIKEEEFFEALDYALASTEIKNGPLYLVKTKGGFVSIPYSKIEYIENASRVLDIHLTDGENIKSIFIRKSFDEEIKEISGDRSFLRIHKSFLINMNHVKKLGQGNIIMESGRRIPVSKTRAAEVKREYLQFISECYR